MKFTLFPTAVLAAAVSLTAFGQNFSGAIYTSTQNGTSVNQNLYLQIPDVYLNGGPQNTNGAGLPNGRYYFQVVNPSTSDLLSTDKAVCRQVEVVGGYIAGVSIASVNAGCAHVNGIANPTTGALPVQLAPFTQTTNNGGVYKLELWQQACTGGAPTISPDGYRVLGLPSCNKTDNFKVKDPGDPGCVGFCDPTDLGGFKYYDTNVNGVYDGPPTELGLAGFNFNLNGVLSATSDSSGNFNLGGLTTGLDYVVCEVLPTSTGTGPVGSYWSQTQPAAGGCYTAKPGDGTLLFGNVCLQKPSGGYTLGFWTNKNGETRFNLNSATYLLGLRNLHLRNTNGSNFDPTTYAQVKKWLADGTAVNMAYMLSVQMSATWLDVNSGSLSGDTVVLSPIFGPKKISDLIAEADAILAVDANSYIIGTMKSPMRQTEENYKTTFDDINNNRLPFVLGSNACTAGY